MMMGRDLKVFCGLLFVIVGVASSGAIYDAFRQRAEKLETAQRAEKLEAELRAERLELLPILTPREKLALLRVGETTRKECLRIMGAPKSRVTGFIEMWSYDLPRDEGLVNVIGAPTKVHFRDLTPTPGIRDLSDQFDPGEVTVYWSESGRIEKIATRTAKEVNARIAALESLIASRAARESDSPPTADPPPPPEQAMSASPSGAPPDAR
jgi:hypothetical protein